MDTQRTQRPQDTVAQVAGVPVSHHELFLPLLAVAAAYVEASPVAAFGFATRPGPDDAASALARSVTRLQLEVRLQMSAEDRLLPPAVRHASPEDLRSATSILRSEAADAGGR